MLFSFECFHIIPSPLSSILLSALAFLEWPSQRVFSTQYLYSLIRQILWWGNSRWLPEGAVDRASQWSLIHKPTGRSNREQLTPIVTLPFLNKGEAVFFFSDHWELQAGLFQLWFSPVCCRNIQPVLYSSAFLTGLLLTAWVGLGGSILIGRLRDLTSWHDF